MCWYSLPKVTVTFLFFHRPYVILAIGVAVLVVVFLFYFLITRGNPPKDVLFFGNSYVRFPTHLQHISNPLSERLIATILCVDFQNIRLEWKHQLYSVWFSLIPWKLIRLSTYQAHEADQLISMAWSPQSHEAYADFSEARLTQSPLCSLRTLLNLLGIILQLSGDQPWTNAHNVLKMLIQS